MNVRHSLVVMSLAALCACEDPPKKPIEPQPPIDPCLGVPKVTATATATTVKVNAPADVVANGGNGHFHYMITTNVSGGTLSGTRYVAGPTEGTDVITAADECGNSSTVAITVKGAFSVLPSTASIKPGTHFQIVAKGPIGSITFTPQSTLASGGTISATGVYTAGSTPGIDLIVVRDSETGEQVVVVYTVSANAALRGRPNKIALPAGASVTLESFNGSGEMKWTLATGMGTVTGDLYSAPADATGTVTVRGDDQFTLETTTITIQILTELTRPTRAQGRRTDAANLVAADFNGDGIQDLALGTPESDLNRPQGGAVFIFIGTANGLPTTADYVLKGDSDTAQLGAVMAAGDLDGDGTADLAIAEPGADVTISDSGAVLLYSFSTGTPRLLRPALTGLGRASFGTALAVADVDNDGNADLIVGSPSADLTGGTFNNRGVIDIFLMVPGQSIPDVGNMRVGGVDLAVDGTLRAFSGVRAGRNILVADVNGDLLPDLAFVTTINNSIIGGVAAARAQTAIQLHFGRTGRAKVFEDTPDLFLLPGNVADATEGTWRLGFIPSSAGNPALLGAFADLTDGPNLTAMDGGAGGSNNGGVMLYDLSAQHPTGAAATSPLQIGRDDAWARLYGDQGGGKAGASFSSADLDGDGKTELLLGSPNSTSSFKLDGGVTVTNTLSGRVLIYPLGALSRGAVANKPTSTRDGSGFADFMGSAMATWVDGSTRMLAVYNSRSFTSEGDYTGRLDLLQGTGPISSWMKTSIVTPAKPGGEGFGTFVDIGSADGKIRAAVSSPTFSAPGPTPYGSDVNAGKVTAFTPGPAPSASVVIVGANNSYMLDSGVRAFGGIPVGSDVTFTDFDGDGRDELVVGAPVYPTATSLPDGGSASTAYARNNLQCMPLTTQSNGGVVMYSAKSDGTWVQSFAAWLLKDIDSCTVPDGGAATICQRFGIAKGLAGHLDFNGDGKQDLVATRNNGLEVILGQASDDVTNAKPSMACGSGFTLPFISQGTSAPAVLGDLDGDGCDEMSVRYSDNNVRIGLIVVFGYDADGNHCMGHTQPAWLRLSGDAETGLVNMKLGTAAARAGKLLGDTRDFIAVTADSYFFEGVAQPTVLLFDSAQLAAKRPVRGERVVSVLNDGIDPIPLVPSRRANTFGRALAGGVDFTGDGINDLIVSAPGASVNGDGTGAVFIFAGGSVVSGRNEIAGLVVSDEHERANFGVDIGVTRKTTTSPAALVIGAPTSYRAGTSNGTAYTISY